MRREAEAKRWRRSEKPPPPPRDGLFATRRTRRRLDPRHAGAGPAGSATSSVHEMAAYWKRLPGRCAGRTSLAPSRRSSSLRRKARAANGVVAKNAQKFTHWLQLAVIIPMLSQTAEMPYPTAKFTTAELDQLDTQMKKLIAMTSGRTSAAAQGSAAGLGHAVARSTKIATSSDKDGSGRKVQSDGGTSIASGWRERCWSLSGRNERKTGAAAEAETEGTPARRPPRSRPPRFNRPPSRASLVRRWSGRPLRARRMEGCVV